MPRRSVDPAFIDSLRGKEFCLCRQGIIAKGFYPHRDSSKNPVSNYCPHDFSSGQRKDDEFVVMKGVEFNNAPYLDGHQIKINQLKTDSCLIEKGELIKNCGFSSPSQAASVILGQSSNGVINWKDENGKTIRELEEEYQNRNNAPASSDSPVSTEFPKPYQGQNRSEEIKKELPDRYRKHLKETSPEDKQQLVNIRAGQNVLRVHLLHTREKCALTGIKNSDLLRVSHIKPWARFENIRLDPNNCLLLSASWDAAFDRGLITFSQEGILKFSNDIIEDLDKIGPYNHAISFDGINDNDIDKHLEYLEWHRDNVFRGNAP